MVKLQSRDMIHPLHAFMDKDSAESSVAADAQRVTVGDPERVQLISEPYCVKLNIRGEATNPAFCAAVESVCHLNLPLTPNTFHSDEHSSLLWLGPNEWQWRPTLVAGEESDPANAFVDKMRSSLSGIHSAVVDVSDYYWLFTMRGPYVYDLLEKGSPLDVRQRIREVGQCAQTRYGNAAVVLNKLPLATVQVQVRWSFADYLWQYLREGMIEFD